MNLKQKTVLITGASRGIGKRLALDLAAEGVNLGLVARNSEALGSVKAEAEEHGVKVLTFTGQVSDERLANKTITSMTESFGQIDYLINNAGFRSEEHTSELQSLM